MYPVRIEGTRVVLREFVESDLDDSMAIVGDPDVTVFLSFDSRTREQQSELLAKDIQRAQSDARPDYYLAIAERDTNQLIGFVRIALDAHQRGELGYALRKDHWGKSIVTEACLLMMDFGFNTLGLHRIQAACGPENHGSQKVLDKLGFGYEGRMRDHVFTNGTWRDSLLYSRVTTDG
ncbi:N-acetyltransferase GCN5 [Rhizocola hellebori]|uniref:N-acetyltransferase GCN5 n=1 Tax=Rhizocola hellebori TaxID=1392758 RepID=A0A8J3VIW8_9ACTN|nr:GNAT family protein [Rhizocola hellebori]GIH08020.1 N-acetyltransferase GCN5 [Rhizocola hellebori]